jgi:ABC-type hemin transport system substrate-binding protein
LQQEQRGREFARGINARIASVAADIPAIGRKSAIYLGVHGTQFYGGARGTSYHDVLHYAGLVDRAAGRYEGWPAYTSEELFVLDPDVIVTPKGQGSALCQRASFSVLKACSASGRVVEVDDTLLVDPGVPMIDAAIAVRLAVYGPPAQLAP